ncbi:hypothetical protein [Dictyobacter kobayashii]|uniref:CHRD domain-containing protein n=1 Tax=Dictyobacter kobayashii TaxID=2014872 RepID=A0A402AMD7_9CHLR|nr:hypothetical protein [Dictyobacter kobayashii]GCE20160.1 hypothetical protein KDK_39600 [Dictyobacter kobayashii]
MLKLSRHKSVILKVTAISVTLCMLILTTVFLAFSPFARASSSHPAATATGTALATGTATTSGATSAVVAAHAYMQHTPNGAIRMTYNAGSKTLSLNPSMNGFAPNSTHPVQIEQGNCRAAGAAQGAATTTASTPLATATTAGTASATKTSPTGTATATTYSTTLTSDATGHIRGNATINNVSAPPSTSNLRVRIYNGPGLQNAAQKVAIACGNIKQYNPNSNAATPTSTGTGFTNSAATSTVTATGTATGASGNTFVAMMGPTDSPNEQASGTTQLSLANGTLTVQMNVHGLAPNSTHSAHIHTGNCQNIGNVVYNLGTLTADAQGNASLNTTVKNVTSIPDNGLAAQVHYGTSLNDPGQYNPIMCGNVRLNKNQPSATSTP